MEQIPLKTVLEVVSEELWWKTCADQGSETGTMTPSLQERIALVEDLLPQTRLKNNTLFLSGGGAAAPPTHIPFYNYLLLENRSDLHDQIIWTLTGFHRFADFHAYLQTSRCRPVAVFVKAEPAPCSHYEKATLHFRKEYPSGKSRAIGWHEFCDARWMQQKAPYLLQQYTITCQIVDLCEFIYASGVSCDFATSPYELPILLNDRVYSYSPTPEPGGTILFGGKQYTYHLDDSDAGFSLYNDHDEPYCHKISGFCPLFGSACDVCTGLP